MPWPRRRLLGGVATVGSALSTGCLGAFESESAWRDLVVDRPDGVYVSPKVDAMRSYETTAAGDYGVAVMAMRPHSFWTVVGAETHQTSMRSTDSLHLTVSVWTADGAAVVPADVAVATECDGDTVDRRSLWPMLSQPMGFHYGDNIALPTPGRYRLRIDIHPSDVGRGEFGMRLEPASLAVPVDYSSAEIDSLERTLLDPDRRGKPGAVPLTHDGRQGHSHGHPPPPVVPDAESLSGRVIGSATVDDAVLTAVLFDDTALSVDDTALSVDGAYLAVFAETPYNGCTLPMLGLDASLRRDETVVEKYRLDETVHPDLTHHYGTPIDAISSSDELRIDVRSPPQVARHEGYETAFLGTGSVSLPVGRPADRIARVENEGTDRE
ncbi:iron transporter [Haloferacaceae archaeon DSL9]